MRFCAVMCKQARVLTWSLVLLPRGVGKARLFFKRQRSNGIADRGARRSRAEEGAWREGHPCGTISEEMITVLTRYRPIVLELI